MAAVLHKPFLFAKLDILKSKIKEKIVRFQQLTYSMASQPKAKSIPPHKREREKKKTGSARIQEANQLLSHEFSEAKHLLQRQKRSIPCLNTR